ncbi:HTH_48 domain-containing protein [Trichonephila clavipes]|nr:HTH_48 domain-containing protein [Trichonephila clavipes]
MFKTNADSSDCKVGSVIRFFNVRNVKPVEIHHQFLQIYGENVRSNGMVRKSVRRIKDGWTNVHDNAHHRRPSVVNDGLVKKVNEKIRYNRLFIVKLPYDEFSQTSIQQRLFSLTAYLGEQGIDKCVSRYDIFQNNGGNYVENSF